jgi:hypothetical protein
MMMRRDDPGAFWAFWAGVVCGANVLALILAMCGRL